MRPDHGRPAILKGPAPRCGACGYDLRGSGRSDRCPECGSDARSTSLDEVEGTDPAGDRGLDLVANSLLASIPAMTGLVLLGWLGLAVTVLAAVLLLFRPAGLWRHRRGVPLDPLPPWFIRSLWITTTLELTAAAAAMAILILPLGLPSPRPALLMTLGGWGLVAGVGIGVTAFGCGRLAREAESPWASRTAVVAGIASILAGVIAASCCGVVSLGWFTSGNPNLTDTQVILTLMVAGVGVLSAAVGILLTRFLLLSIEAHAISTAIDARRMRRDPLLEVGVPVTPVDAARIEDDPLPLAPAKPPVRRDRR